MNNTTSVKGMLAATSGSSVGIFDSGHHPEYIWQDDAACAFQPSTLFEVAEEGSEIAKGLSPAEISDLNSANFERAGEICASCPVFDECAEDMTTGDFLYVFRAGHAPDLFIDDRSLTPRKPVGRPKGSLDKVPRKRRGTAPQIVPDDNLNEASRKKINAVPLGGTCTKGHEGYLVRYPSGKKRCRWCNAIEKRLKTGNTDTSPPKDPELTDTCVNGHVGKYARFPNGRRNCTECYYNRAR